VKVDFKVSQIQDIAQIKELFLRREENCRIQSKSKLWARQDFHCCLFRLWFFWSAQGSTTCEQFLAWQSFCTESEVNQPKSDWL